MNPHLVNGLDETILETLAIEDCITYLKRLPDNSIDALVTDPPAGISFMGTSWDTNRGGRREWIAWMAEVMTECLRVVKPGGHALVWSLPRTSHWTASALEDAGWEIRDCVTHLFGSGFPKSLDVSKQLDKLAGQSRSKTRTAISPHTTAGKGFSNEIDERPWMTQARLDGYHEHDDNVALTPLAQQYDGWGTALKPAAEFWWLARKPPSEPTVARNIARWGTGALNIDGCRNDAPVPSYAEPALNSPTGLVYGFQTGAGRNGKMSAPQTGRWPANLVLDEQAASELDASVAATKSAYRPPSARERNNGVGLGSAESRSGTSNAPDNYGDSGGPSRFFYVAKASRSERNAGCEDLPAKAMDVFGDDSWGERERANVAPSSNYHPTVKSLALMRWLCRMVTPPGGVVLDPFAGSGSTLIAARQEGFHWTGCEKSPEYAKIAVARLGSVE